MRTKRVLSLLCVLMVMASCLTMSAGAAGTSGMAPMASGRFSMEVDGDSMAESYETLPLEEGDMVRIKATYTPSNANVEFGLIAPDGLFYSVTCTTGRFDKYIKAVQTGNYTFAVLNNSEKPVKVSGTITY